MRWDLALRALLVVPPLALVFLLIADSPVIAGAACLAALLILLCDFRRPNAAAYLITGLGCLAATGLGVLALPVLPTVVLVAAVTAGLTVVRGFGGFASVAAVTVIAELLIAVGLRAAGASAADILVGVLVGAAVSVPVAIAFPTPERTLATDAREATQAYAAALCGEPLEPGSGQELVAAYLQSTDRPQAPTRSSADDLHRLSALARLGDLLDQPHETDEFTRACAQALRGGASVPTGSTDWQLQVAYAVSVVVAPNPISNGEWRRQLRVRLRPDSLLFVQASLAAVLYGLLTALVLTLTPPHPQWILLGAVTATYPYARRSAIVVRNLLIGTLLAFAALLILAPVGNAHPALWWVVFIVACGVATGVPHTTKGWIVGQMAFTSISLSLLAVSAQRLPAEAIEVRLENVLIGGGAAVLVALVLAPRHMRRRLQLALADLYAVVAVPDLDLCRAHFLRCIDILDSVRGARFVATDRVVRWTDGARNAVQLAVVAVLTGQSSVPTVLAYEAAMRHNTALPDYPGGSPDVAALFAAQRHDFVDLTPLRPRSRLER